MKLHIRRQPRVLTRFGDTTVVRIGEKPRVFGDLYHWLLTSPRWQFGLTLVGTYLGLNALFALAYLACGNAILNAQPGSFEDAFFFSVQTMATIGYGQMSPAGIAANILVTIEAGLGLFGIAVASGLMFARFTRPTAGVRFSAKLVVTQYEGRPTLMFRLANERVDRIHEARIHLSLLRNQITAEGHQYRRIYDLTPMRSFTPVFGLTWTVMHYLDGDSPLAGLSAEQLIAEGSQIAVLFSGHHAGFYQEVHERAVYDAADIEWNARFADLFRELPDGRYAMDFGLFDQTLADETRAIAAAGPTE